MADPDRKGGSGLSLRTLAIASAASVTAAMVSSRIFPPGTVYASAVTPVIVAAVSEILNRPVDRVTQLARQRRTLVLETRRLEASRVGDPAAAAGTGDFAERAVEDELATNGNGAEPSFRVHGRRRLPRQLLHPKLWLVTGVAAFAIAVAVLTLPELIFGGAVATSHRTTFFGGGASSATTTQTQTTPTTTTPTQTTPTQTVPTQTTPTTTTPTQTTPAQTDTQVAPSGGSTAPAATGTSTAP